MIKHKLLSLLVALIATTNLFASNIQVDGIWYDFNDTKLTASVTYRGASYNDYSGEYTGSVVIPASVSYSGKAYSVTTIGECAFYGCSSLTSVTIPNSVRTIGHSAFLDCSGLTSVTIPNSVTTIGSVAFRNVNNIVYNGIATGSPWGAKWKDGYIDDYFVFSDSTRTILCGCSSAKKSIVIPYSVTTIRDNAFSGSLDTVTINSSTICGRTYTYESCLRHIFGNYVNTYIIGDSVKSIGSNAFCHSNTRSIIIGKSVTAIGEWAFSYCGLSSITIPNSVKIIGKFAFGYHGVASVTLGDSVKTICEYAFYNCSLTSITIPSSVITIEDKAFCECSSLKTVYNGSILNVIKGSTSNGYVAYYANTVYPGILVGDFLIKQDSIVAGYVGNATDITIPNGITQIRASAFSGCSGLTSVTIPNSVKSIGSNAFSGCSGLTSVTIPNSVTTIGDLAFYNCTGLTSVTIPNSVKTIGNNAFYGCKNVYYEDYFNQYSSSYPSNIKCKNPISCSIDKKIFNVSASLSVPEIYYEWYDEIGLADSKTSTANHYAADSNGKIEFTDMPLNYSGMYYFYARRGEEYVYQGTITISTKTPSLSCSVNSQLFAITLSNISASTDETVQTLTKGVKFNGQYYEADENNIVTLSNLQLGRSYTIYLYGYYNGEYYEQSKTISTKTPSLSCSVNSQHFAITLSNISASTDETVQTLTKGVKFNGQYYEADENNTVTLSDLQLGRSYTIYLYGCYNGNYYEQSKTVSTKTPSLSCSSSATQTTITLSDIYASSDTSVHSLSKGIYYNYKRYEADENNKVVITGIVPNTKCTLQIYGCYNGNYFYGDSKYVTTKSIAPVLTVTESPTCVYAKGSYTHGDATILGTSVACTTTGSSVVGDEGLMTGLKPNKSYSFTYSVDTKEGGTYTATKTITTPALTLTTLTPKVVSEGKVVVAASTNISDLETNVGFEWRKYNAPPELPSSRAQAILYNGQMEGILHNLSLEYWRVRAYYEAADGTCYYGEWATFDPSQPAFFEPTVHTYALVTDPTANKVQMRGYVMTGTDDVTEQGFEYWFKGAKAPRRVVSATPDSVYRVQASGQVMTAVLEDLAYSTTYTCRAYAVAGGKTYYGEEVQFLTPEDPRPIYTLYVMAGENGSVNTDVSGQYREGEIVTLTATPMAGYHFLQWSDGNTDNPRQLTIMADTELVALFELADGLEQLIIDNAQGTVRKFIHNNQLFIFHNGNLYTATGARVK